MRSLACDWGYGMGSRATEISQGPARALRGATLALIVERAGHGYELADRLRRRLGPSWQIDKRQIYPILDELERKGLVTRTEEANPARPRQPRQVYYATERAPEVLANWMRGPVQKEAVRSDVMARIASARPEDAPGLLSVLDEYEAEVLQLIEETGEGQSHGRSWTGLLMDVAHDQADAHLQAELGWIVSTRRRLREYLASLP